MSKKKLVITFIVIGLLSGVFFCIWKGCKLWEQTFFEPFRYRECEPTELLPELESAFDINFPEEIEQAMAARTSGCWDSSRSHFAVRLAAEPNAVDALLNTLHSNTTFEAYRPESDNRDKAASRLKTPEWFTQTIREGRKAESPHKVEVYIDTTNARQLVVYVQGQYFRDANEISEELTKEGHIQEHK